MNILDTYTEKETIRYVLKAMGVAPHLDGYAYCGRAIELVLEDETYLKYITKRLYVDIAKDFHTTIPRVERAIRHAIEYALDHGTTNGWIYHVFGTFANKPIICNSLFIATIADLIMYEKHHPIFMVEVPR